MILVQYISWLSCDEAEVKEVNCAAEIKMGVLKTFHPLLVLTSDSLLPTCSKIYLTLQSQHFKLTKCTKEYFWSHGEEDEVLARCTSGKNTQLLIITEYLSNSKLCELRGKNLVLLCHYRSCGPDGGSKGNRQQR